MSQELRSGLAGWSQGLLGDCHQDVGRRSQARWQASVEPATWKAEARGLLEPRGLSPDWAT